jgi:hypothetical protein
MARPKKEVQAQSVPASPNEELTELSELNYRALNGEAWNKYQEVEQSLFMNDKYDYEVWFAQPTMKWRINEDTGEREQYQTGVQINNGAIGGGPLMISRVSVMQARENNKHAKPGASESRNSKYYFLVQPKKQTAEAV